jgi:hypothetical protein
LNYQNPDEKISEDKNNSQGRKSSKKWVVIGLIVLFLFCISPIPLELINLIIGPPQNLMGVYYFPVVKVGGFLIGCYLFFRLIMERLNSGTKK